MRAKAQRRGASVEFAATIQPEMTLMQAGSILCSFAEASSSVPSAFVTRTKHFSFVVRNAALYTAPSIGTNDCVMRQLTVSV